MINHLKPRNRRSIRMHGYDYSQNGIYYVTLCTQGKACLFGNIVNADMVLNEYGKIAETCWLDIPLHFPNVLLHEYVIMPNHIHGIIEITKANNGLSMTDISNPFTASATDSLPKRNGTSKTIGSIIRGFKIGVTKSMRAKSEINIVWQRNYYEHIIRDGNDYDRIVNYIRDNPVNWAKDFSHYWAKDFSPVRNDQKYRRGK